MTVIADDELSAALLRPVRGHHAFEGCVEQLGTAIRLGIYPHGSTLPPERELAVRLAVSRATVRQAIAALRSARLVKTTRGRGGGSVVEHRPDLGPRRVELLDTLVFRRVVEPGSCHIAAGRELTHQQRQLLNAAHEAVSHPSDPASHRQADSRFHLAIATVTESPMTVRAVTAVQAGLHDMLNAIPVLEVNIAHSDRQHQSILDAVLSHDAVKARRVMERHCDDTAALLHGLLG